MNQKQFLSSSTPSSSSSSPKMFKSSSQVVKASLAGQLNKVPAQSKSKRLCAIVEATVPMPPDFSASSHAVLIEKPVGPLASPPIAYPLEYIDGWDSHYVRLPCSANNVYVAMEGDEKEFRSRWELIRKALESPIKNSYAIERCILSYNSRYTSQWDFSGLHNFFREHCSAEERAIINEQTLPAICKLALKLPLLCTQPLPLLRTQQARSVTMSQEQASCLLANAFLCTFPRRNTIEKGSEYDRFPRINFSTLFIGNKGKCTSVNAAKLRSIFHYFNRVAVQQVPIGTITFERKVSRDFPAWEECTEKLRQCTFLAEGKIEDEGCEYVMLDFANKFIGGGVLSRGSVQEEILFMIYPELIVSRLLCEELADNESLMVYGCERFSSYAGYGSSFAWSKPFYEKRDRDAWGRLANQVLAIDAYIMSNFEMQLHDKFLYRELNKAFSGFHYNSFLGGRPAALATGNWGCGAFGGDPIIKALIQLMTAAVCGRDLLYFTFGDERLQTRLVSMYSLLKEKATVGDILAALVAFRRLKLNGQGLNTGYDSAGNPRLLKFLRDYFEEANSIQTDETRTDSSSTLSSAKSSSQSIVFKTTT
eukprot:Nk52_evm10s368 gene=Nk52_evmTU10s368